MNQCILLDRRPRGRPELSDFRFVNEAIPSFQAGEMLLKARYVSVDPYLRGRMNDAQSYVAPFELNRPIASGTIAEVVESSHPGFDKGDFVLGNLAWKEYQTSDGIGLNKLNGDGAPLSAYLGVLGMPGLTAYLGMTEIGAPREGETVVVSGAAGAVGSTAGQVARILGCRVVGIAGSDEKAHMLTSEFGFDEAINYKSTSNMRRAIAAACPGGVDVYFDNVGGHISDSVLVKMNKHSRIVVCGAISMYNERFLPKGLSVQPFLIQKSALMKGFIVDDFEDKYPEALKRLSAWLGEGRLKYAETIVEGFDRLPQAFMDLFDGKNRGKMLVRVT